MLSLALQSCSDSEPAPRSEEDILGVWTDANGRYLYFDSETMVFDLRLSDADGEKSYTIMQDSYFYEPGYNFVILLDFMAGIGNEGDSWEDMASPDVFQVTELTPSQLRWCLVDNLSDKKYEGMSKKQIIGAVLKEADKGFTLLPSNYSTYSRVSDEDFKKIIKEYKIWELDDELPDWWE